MRLLGGGTQRCPEPLTRGDAVAGVWVGGVALPAVVNKPGAAAVQLLCGRDDAPLQV